MRKILILERGGFWLPEHFQNLPLPYKMVLGGPSETFPWTLSSKTWRTESLKYMHGSCPFFGGRSTFWSAWCPAPEEELMRGFPESMIETTRKPGFWENAKALLHVTPADEIEDKVFGKLQKDIDAKLKQGIEKIEGANHEEPGPLAVGKQTPTSTLSFVKFSTPGPLLTLYEKQRQLAKRRQGSPLVIATDVVVKKFLTDPDNDNTVNVLQTSRGDLCFPNGNTNIILATGAVPATTILLNSLEGMQTRAGKRLTGHFLSHVTARFPIDRERFPKDSLADQLEIAASYLAGIDKSTNMQYHIQITAMHSPHPEYDAVDAARECPDYAAAATQAQLTGSEDWIVLVCATLRELTETNPNSWVKRNANDPDVTTNITLQVTLDSKDESLWNVMDNATNDAIAVMADKKVGELQYWHNASLEKEAGWSTVKPPIEEVRVPGVVHEASLLYMGPESDPTASVDANYRPFSCKNAYVTGAALFPSAGSWNPTLTMCAYAQDLAEKLCKKSA